MLLIFTDLVIFTDLNIRIYAKCISDAVSSRILSWMFSRVVCDEVLYVCCTWKVLTKDSVTVSVDAVVYYRVSNATVSVANVENAHHSTRLLAQTTLRNVLGTKNLSEILSERESIAISMQVSCALRIKNSVVGYPLSSSLSSQSSPVNFIIPLSRVFISWPTLGAYVSPQCLECYNRP